MRSLNKSLPSSPRPRSTQPPEQLLQAFRTAALSVTNLYKTAALDQNQARQSGYQDALDELLTFLDKENLGLGDGEGWRVRQWATERLDGAAPAQAGSESDDDRGETEKQAGSPPATSKQENIPESSQAHPPSRSGTPVRTEDSPPPAPPPSVQQPASVQAHSDTFTFRAAHQYPQEVDMNVNDATTNTPPQTENATSIHNPAVQVNIMPRGTRNSHRHTSLQSRHNTRSGTTIRNLGAGAGSKRRVTFPDFFDIGNLGDGKEPSGGPVKRNRLN